MKRSCSISHLFAAAGLVLVGNVYAMDNVKKQAVDFVDGNKTTLAVIAINTAQPEDADAAKAALETAAFALDNKKASPEMLIGNFVINYLARKSARCAVKNGYTLDAIASKMDVLPANLSNHVKPIVKEAAKAAAPQLIAGALTKNLARQ